MKPTGSPRTEPRGLKRALILTCALTLAATAALLMLAASGCKDDKKITPPPPPSDYLEQSSAANVLTNLKTACTKRNDAEFEKLFAPDYVFLFNPYDVNDPENPTPAQWNRADELDAAHDLFTNADVDTIQIAWSLGQAEPTDTIPNGWRVRADAVNLDVYWRNENHELWIFQVRGSYQDFYLREDPNVILPGGAHRWLLVRWDDGPIGGLKVEQTTWGRIKHVFRKP
jgi:hypothetical protein